MYLKRTVFLISVFLALAMAGYAQYTVDLPYKQVTVENAGGKAVFHGVASYGKPGQPSLPAYSVTFLLPPGTNPEDVTVSVQNPVAEELSEVLYVAPARPPVSLDNKPDVLAEYPQDMSVYGNNAFFPGSWTGAVSFGKYRKYQLVKVSINACVYNPVLQKVRILTGGTLVLTLKGQSETKQKSLSPDALQNSLQSAKAVEPFLKNLIINPEALAEYATASQSLMQTQAVGESQGYAIITTNAIVNASTQLQNLIDQKTLKGYNVILATEDDWGDGTNLTGDAAAEHIRAWLKEDDRYLTENIKYVLLIGNPNPLNGDVPMKATYPMQDKVTGVVAADKMHPSDFYYAELSGDWNIGGGDNYYGSYYSDFVSGGADQYAEVAVGRIPYYGSITDLDHILAKSISYADATDRTWRKKIMLPMKAGYEYLPGTYALGEQIKNSFCTTGEWNYYRLYDEINPYNDNPVSDVSNMCPLPESRSCTIPKVLDAWTSNFFGLVIWCTHGSPTYAADVFDSSSAPSLFDNRPSMTFQQSCNNSSPEESDNLAYSILLNGGITTIGATRESWGIEFYTDTQNILNIPYAEGITYGYAGRVMNDGLASADALFQTFANLELSDYDAYGWMDMVEFCLYGCPDLALDIPTEQPGGPTDLRTNFSTPNAITLHWSDNSNCETGYCIERARMGGVFAEIDQIAANSTSYTDTYNLLEDTVYRYRVRAVNGSVYSLYSSICYGGTATNIALGKTVVASSAQSGHAPANAVDGNDTSTSWRAANTDFPQFYGIDLGSVLPVSRCELVFETTGTSGDCYDYILSTSVDNVNWTDRVNLPNNPDTAQTQVHNLNTQARYIRLSFLDAPGSNPAGMYEIRVFGSPCPSKPVWGTCDYANDDQLALSWEPVAGAMYYTLKRSIYPNGPFSTVATNLTTTSFNTTALRLAFTVTTYYFIVSATNDDGCEGEDSDVLAMSPIWTAPYPPTGLSVTEHYDTAPYLYITWTDQSHGDSGYNLERKAFGQSDWTLIAQTSSSDLSDPGHLHYTNYKDYSISPHTAYAYRVCARGVMNNSDYTGPATAKPYAPFALTAYSSGMTVHLFWQDAGFSQDLYGIEWSNDGVTFLTYDSVPYTQTSYIDTWASPGMTYYYRVYSGNALSQSDYSEIVSVTMPAEAVTIYYKAQETAASTNQLQPWFKIKNIGTTTIDLANVTLRYWYTLEGTASQSAACDYAGLGGVNVTSFVNTNLVPVTPALTGANYYLEISFDSGVGSLSPGQETDAIQLRIRKSDWTDYTQTNDYSFDASMTSFTANPKLTGYIGGTLSFGALPQ